MRAATAADDAAIREVEIAAFERDAEADIVEAVRAAGAALVELVAEADGRIVGHVLLSRMTCEPPAFFAGLAPVAVSPAEQSRGVGAALCRAGIEAVRALGADAVVVLGHPAYYPRFGFSAEAAKPLASPYAGSPAFMALALKPGALASTRRVDYPAAFG